MTAKPILSIFLLAQFLTLSCNCGNFGTGRDRELHVLSTNDVHGAWSDSTYDGVLRPSLQAVATCIDSIRNTFGEANVLLLDSGDCLQGDNAAYYFNYVDTLGPHLFARIASDMGYDAVTVGNHDIETGHAVYDRVRKDLKRAGIPFLGGNIVKTSNGRPYFPTFKVFRKAGMKVLVLGYSNANIKSWLDESLWSGLDFKSLLPLVQEDVDRLRARIHPDAVVVSVHSGTGLGDGSVLESQGLDLYESLRGVDFLLCSHDHRELILQNDSICLMNSGSKARFLAHGTLKVVDGKKTLSAELVKTDPHKSSERMRERFADDFAAVRDFSTRKVGYLGDDMYTRDSYLGMCDYMNLIHVVSLSCAPAQISFAAPLTYNGVIPAGPLVYNDLFKIYPFENQLFIVRMSGKEIKDYLEYSYEGWVNTISSTSDHALKIQPQSDSRTGAVGWSFIGRTYNFDSAAGLSYTVDLTRNYGSRVRISSMADGSAFCADSTYNVAMTSYRASGGGALMTAGAHIDSSSMDDRIVAKYPEMRELIYQYLIDNGGAISSRFLLNQRNLGRWRFVPDDLAFPALASDFSLLF